MKILVVDDSKFMLNIIKKLLEKDNYEVVTVASGIGALRELIKHRDFDLVTLDVNMPHMDGFETCRNIRLKKYEKLIKKNSEQELPVIFITGRDTAEDRKKGFELGATDFISKDFLEVELQKLVNKILRPDKVFNGLTALIIEQTSNFRNAISEPLRREGVKVYESSDGMAGLEIFKNSKNNINMVILDYYLPTLNGHQLLLKIRNESKNIDLPIIMVSELSDKNIQIQLFKDGLTDLLTKPFIQEELIARLDIHIKNIIHKILLEKNILELENHKKYLEEKVVERTRTLKEAQEQLLEASRHAGMAEIATDVIHNIGNALNSINISAEVTKANIDDLQLNIINKIVELMDDHKEDLGDFMSNTKKGQLIPVLLKEFAAHIAEDKGQLNDEVKKMKASVEHIQSIIQVQQSNAKNILVVDLQNPIELFETAIQMNESSINRHDISLEKEFGKESDIKTDRHKVLQILINLISNAKGAFTDILQSDKKIICRITKSDGFLDFSVIDNGIGIPKENLDKIFNYGFTTKKTGHGFGLHNSANTAEQLKGSLIVTSEGSNKGASFSLKIPYQSEGAKSE